MEHFYQNIESMGFGPMDLDFYFNTIQDLPDDFHAVELGSWLGQSAAFFAVEAINSGKKFKFDCVDIWGGDIEGANAPSEEFYNAFIDNMKPVEGYYIPLWMSCTEASKLYEDESLDFVFIDACHAYESVVEDITTWLPKVKKGAILAGHDITHPPVLQAVTDLLGDKWKRYGEMSNSWSYVKE